MPYQRARGPERLEQYLLSAPPGLAGDRGLGCDASGTCAACAAKSGSGLGQVILPDGADLMSPSTWGILEWAGVGLAGYLLFDTLFTGVSVKSKRIRRKFKASRRRMKPGKPGSVQTFGPSSSVTDSFPLWLLLIGGAVAAAWWLIPSSSATQGPQL